MAPSGICPSNLGTTDTPIIIFDDQGDNIVYKDRWNQDDDSSKMRVCPLVD